MFFGKVDDGFTVRRGGEVLRKCGLGALFTTEPPVVIRVGLRVIEAHIRRGFAVSHISMLALTCEGVVRSVRADGRLCVRTLLTEAAQRLPDPHRGCQRVARSVGAAKMQQKSGS